MPILVVWETELYLQVFLLLPSLVKSMEKLQVVLEEYLICELQARKNSDTNMPGNKYTVVRSYQACELHMHSCYPCNNLIFKDSTSKYVE